MGLFMLFEIGFLQLFYDFSAWELSVMVYGCVILGLAVQAILFKCCRGKGKWAFFALLGAALLACEIGYHVITGWDELLTLFFYGAALCLLLGALLAALLRALKRK